MRSTTIAARESADALTSVDPRELRNTFGNFATGVTVVSAYGTDGVPHGATVNAFTAVSLEPALAQVTLTRETKAAQIVPDNHFAINILSREQCDVAWHFAGKPRIEGEVPWDVSADAPALVGNAATLQLKPWRTYDGGDHLIVIGEVTSIHACTADPLLFFRGKFQEIGALVA